jgi:nucleoid-associated protein YgaU
VILTGSRYMGQPVLTVPTAQGLTATVYAPAPVVSPSFTYYTVKDGDRFDNIAALIYGVADYWWKIANANPEVFYPDMLVVGSILRIPA